MYWNKSAVCFDFSGVVFMWTAKNDCYLILEKFVSNMT